MKESNNNQWLIYLGCSISVWGYCIAHESQVFIIFAGQNLPNELKRSFLNNLTQTYSIVTVFVRRFSFARHLVGIWWWQFLVERLMGQMK